MVLSMEYCFYLPKEIMADEYREYSAETKLLFAMLLSNSKTSSAIIGVARLIDELGSKEINFLHKELQKTIAESEGA